MPQTLTSRQAFLWQHFLKNPLIVSPYFIGRGDVEEMLLWKLQPMKVLRLRPYDGKRGCIVVLDRDDDLYYLRLISPHGKETLDTKQFRRWNDLVSTIGNWNDW